LNDVGLNVCCYHRCDGVVVGRWSWRSGIRWRRWNDRCYLLLLLLLLLLQLRLHQSFDRRTSRRHRQCSRALLHGVARMMWLWYCASAASAVAWFHYRIGLCQWRQVSRQHLVVIAGWRLAKVEQLLGKHLQMRLRFAHLDSGIAVVECHVHLTCQWFVVAAGQREPLVDRLFALYFGDRYIYLAFEEFVLHTVSISIMKDD
jgi:hypothetical protein